MDSSYLPSNYVGPKSPSRSSDFKSIIESKFRERKANKKNLRVKYRSLTNRTQLKNRKLICWKIGLK